MKNLELVQGIYAAFGRGDVPAIMALHRPDSVWTIPGKAPYSGTFRGPAGVAEFFGKLVGASDLAEFTPERFVDGGDTIVVLGRERITSKKTKRTAVNRWVQVWTLEGGLVRSFEEYLDTAALAEVFGS